jgi:hypothetical protein
MFINRVVLSLVLCGLYFSNLVAEPELSQSPEALEYFDFGGRLANNTGLSVSGSVNLSMTARLFSSETGGTAAYIQIFQAVTLTNGFFHLRIGPALPDLLQNTYLELEVAGQTLSPRRKFLTQPYAIHARIAENANNADRLSGLTLEEVETSIFSKAGIQPLTGAVNLKFSSAEGQEIRAENITVSGVVTAFQFSGDGTNLSNVVHPGDVINTSQITNTGVLSIGDIAATGTVTAVAFVGDGSGLSGVLLPGGSINTDQIRNNGVLSIGDIAATGTVTAAAFVGDGSGLTSLASQTLIEFGNTNVSIGTTPGNTPHIHVVVDGEETMFITSVGIGLGQRYPSEALEVVGTILASQFSGDGTNLTNVVHPGDPINTGQISDNGGLSVGDIAATGTVTAVAFVGDGSGLSGVLLPGASINTDQITNNGALSVGDIAATGTVTAAAFVGDGSALSGVVIQGAAFSTNQSITLSADGGRALVIKHSSSETAGTTKIAVRNLSGDTFGVTVDGDIGFFGHIRRLTSTLHGNQSFGHTNLGDFSVTGGNGLNRQYATIGGGFGNSATQDFSTISGGQNNTASGLNSFIGGGMSNQVGGDYSVIPGGRLMNLNGADSFAFNGTGVSQTVTAGLTGSAVFMVNHFGIGTTNPTARLHVDGRLRATTVRSNWLISNQAILASSSDAPLRVVTGELPSQTVLVVTSSGRVGIGTTQPLAKLHVDGTLAALRFVGDGSQLTNLGSSSVIRDTDGDTGIMVEDNPDEDMIHMGTAGLERLIITNSGDVGIGITAPLSRLHVDGTVKASGFEGDGSLLTSIPMPSMITSDTTFIEIDTTTPGTPPHIHIQVDGIQPMFISSIGLGLGVAFPTQALEVSGVVIASQFSGDGTSLTNVIHPGDNASLNTLSATTVSATVYFGDGSSLSGVLHTGDNFSAGTVTVATLSDGLASLSSGVLSAVEVGASTVTASEYFGDGSNLTNLPSPSAITSQNTTIEIDTTTPGTPEHIHVFVDSVDRMFISSVGVGIGVSFPQVALDVSGDISVSGNIIASGNLSGTLLTAVQPNITSLGILTTVTVSSADINGGNIDATLIGATSATTGTFTDLVASDGLNVGFSGLPMVDTVSIGDANHAVSLNTNGDPVYAFDVNDFMGYIRSSDQLRFVVNNADAIRILSDGKVGIGTSTPGTKLEVSGKILATSMESTGAVTATTFYGDGSNLTNLPASGAGQSIGSTGVLFDQVYISRDSANNLYGTSANTHVNLGINSTTGQSGQDYKYSTVGGGLYNTASYNYSTVGGGNSNTASDYAATVGGGRQNEAAGLNSAIVGGRNLKISGQGSMGFRGGDNSLQITRSASDTVFFMETALCVGEDNTSCNATSYTSGVIYSAAVTSTGNITAAAFYGDGSNLTNLPASGAGQTIGSTGVLFDQIFISRDVDNNLYGTGANTHVNLGIDSDTGESGQNHSYSSVAGGFRNTASNWYAFVGGGTLNQASGQNAVVSGGKNNIASNFQTTVGGGFNNTASGSHSTIGGGLDNTASGLWTSVSGGSANTAVGDYSVIPGGRLMTLNADDSFAFNGTGTPQTVTSGMAGSAVFMVDQFGIGTASPATKLDVNGQIKATSIESSGAVTATTFYGDGSQLTGILSGGSSEVVTVSDIEFSDGTTLGGDLVAFAAEKNAGNQTLANNSKDLVTFPAEVYDYGSDYDVSTSKFTAPVKGIYLFNVMVMWSPTVDNTNLQLFLMKNGSTDVARHIVTATSTPEESNIISIFLLLDATNTIEVKAIHSSGTSIDIKSPTFDTYFQGMLMRKVP